MITFRLSCIPPKASHHAKKVVRIKLKDGRQFTKMADKPELVQARETLDALLRPHQPETPLDGPVSLSLEFTWPWLSSTPKRTRALGRVPHTSKPDADNVAKTFTDRLTALAFIGPDSRVAELHVRKFWGDEPGIVVAITAIFEAAAP